VSWACGAKLFTVGCGERTKLSSPPMNNFGVTIRVAPHGYLQNTATRCRDPPAERTLSHTPYRGLKLFYFQDGAE
jgi:hypothetical protein